MGPDKMQTQLFSKPLRILALGSMLLIPGPGNAEPSPDLEPDFEMNVPKPYPDIPHQKKYCKVWVTMKPSGLKQADGLTVEFLDVKPDSSYEEIARQAANLNTYGIEPGGAISGSALWSR